jgi:hypothetical protein
MPLPRSTAEILGLYADTIRADMRKCLPATVTAVCPNRQTVDVQIAINQPLFTDLGDVVTETAPSISDVPLGIMRGGGFFVWLPVAVGDSVLLVFSDLSTDTWRSGEGQPQPPGFMGVHTADSPFAIPMIQYDSKFFSDPNNAPTKVIIGHDGSAAQIRLSATDIELGNAVTGSIALSQKIDLFIQTVMGWIPVADDGGAALKTALTTAGFTITTTTASAVAKSQ